MVFTLRDGKVDAVKERNVIKADGKSFFLFFPVQVDVAVPASSSEEKTFMSRRHAPLDCFTPPERPQI